MKDAKALCQLSFYITVISSSISGSSALYFMRDAYAIDCFYVYCIFYVIDL